LRKHALYLAKGEFERDEDTIKCLKGTLGKKIIKNSNYFKVLGFNKTGGNTEPRNNPVRNNI